MRICATKTYQIMSPLCYPFFLNAVCVVYPVALTSCSVSTFKGFALTHLKDIIISRMICCSLPQRLKPLAYSYLECTWCSVMLIRRFWNGTVIWHSGLQSGLNLSSVWSSNKKIKINVWSLHSWFKTTIFLFCVELYLCLYRILPQSKDMLVKLIGCGHVCKVWMVVWFYALTWQLLQHPMTAGTDWDPYSERSSRPIVLFL